MSRRTRRSWFLTVCILIGLAVLAAWYFKRPEPPRAPAGEKPARPPDQQQASSSPATAAAGKREPASNAGSPRKPAHKGAGKPSGTASPDRTFAYAGLPEPTAAFPYRITVLRNRGYVVGYCEKRKDPAWVCYRAFKVNNLAPPERPESFAVDPRTEARVTPRDYTGSGFDRGHMAPNYVIAICYGPAAQMETFLMSNIIPQTGRLNRGIWNRLEQTIARDYAREFGEVWVTAGPAFDSRIEKLKSGVEVPDACWMIVTDEDRGRVRALAFLFDQNAGGERLEKYLTSIDRIEAQTGLNFMQDLPDDVETQLESKVATGLW